MNNDFNYFKNNQLLWPVFSPDKNINITKKRSLSGGIFNFFAGISIK